MLCMPVFLAVRWRLSLRGTAHLTEENARRLSPSDLRTTLPDFALLQSGHSQAHIARQIGVDPSTISRELVRNTGARGYRFKQAHEKASQRRQEASDKPRKMTPDLVELIEEKLTQSSGVPIRSAGVWRRMASPLSVTSASISMSGKTRRRGHAVSSLASQRQKYNRRKGKNSGRGLFRTASISISGLLLSPQKAASETGRPTRLSAPITKALSCRTSSKPPNTPARQTAGQERDSVVQACARVLLPLADQIETITYDNGKEFPLTPKSQPRWGHYPILPSPITRGNAASTNTLTASSGSTSQKVPTSLFCPMPMSKGSRTNSTLAPERYSATKPLARFSSAPEICPLHFTVEWARQMINRTSVYCRMQKWGVRRPMPCAAAVRARLNSEE